MEKRANRVNAERWAMIEPLLRPGEDAIENTPGRIAGPSIPGNYEGFAFLTDQAFLFAAEFGPLKTERWRFEFAHIWDVQGNEDMPGTFAMAVHEGEPSSLDECTPLVFALYPSPFSLQIFRGLVAGARAAHAD